MKTKFYKAFTLIEMLVVMAIMIILMGVGITGGRALIQRANRIAHANAAKQIYNAGFSFYGEKGVFPSDQNLDTLISNTQADDGLGDYLESFDGGSDATFYYLVSSDKQYMVVCVTNGGQAGANTVTDLVCEGNGFGQGDLGANSNLSSAVTISEKNYKAEDPGGSCAIVPDESTTSISGFVCDECDEHVDGPCTDWSKENGFESA